ncbi:MAG: short-chain dehydrogenase [Candidatus Arcticimaribacter sp.]|nr:MAG: short-chain dehydrogenase [Candidatus Arcticimaribacter sp.]PTM02477.1 MAG: short-chain dehydrogenase [Candidatus Arcticimaribacter sp.]
MKTTILITGTSRGIGKALAVHFLSQGATVIGSSRKTQSELAHYPNFFSLKLDLSNPESRVNAALRVKENFDSIDMLINNAGIGPDIDHCSPSESHLENTLSVNLMGTILFTEELIDHITLRGKIINISSKMGSITFCEKSDSVAYRVSKTALNMYTQILSVRVKKGLAIAAVHPGWVKTSFAPSNINGRLTATEAAQKIYDFVRSSFKSGIFWDVETNQEIPW